MRVLLFDWLADGHHAMYLRRVAEVLADHADVALAVPDEAQLALSGAPARFVSLGSARPPIDPSKYLNMEVRRVMRQERALFAQSVRRERPDHAIHMFADTVLQDLLFGARVDARVTVLLFRPRRHYPALYASPLTGRDRLMALVHDGLVSAWRRRSEAHAVLTLDEGAAQLWSSRPGAPSYWFPEPPIESTVESLGAHARSGAVMFGAIGPRKGLGLIARALTEKPTNLALTIAGSVELGFAGELSRLADDIRASGVTLALRPRWHAEREALALLSTARCALLPYVDHWGMSRVLLEAASVGTPVIVPNQGLLGHLVRTHGLGYTVDAADPVALRAAILRLTDDPSLVEHHQDALRQWSARYSQERFREAVLAPLQERNGTTSQGRKSSPRKPLIA